MAGLTIGDGPCSIRSRPPPSDQPSPRRLLRCRGTLGLSPGPVFSKQIIMSRLNRLSDLLCIESKFVGFFLPTRCCIGCERGPLCNRTDNHKKDGCQKVVKPVSF